jgi:hypothetical protein
MRGRDFMPQYLRMALEVYAVIAVLFKRCSPVANACFDAVNWGDDILHSCSQVPTGSRISAPEDTSKSLPGEVITVASLCFLGRIFPVAAFND